MADVFGSGDLRWRAPVDPISTTTIQDASTVISRSAYSCLDN